MRVCQFRHFGRWTTGGRNCFCFFSGTTLLFYRRLHACQTAPVWTNCQADWQLMWPPTYRNDPSDNPLSICILTSLRVDDRGVVPISIFEQTEC